MISENQIKQQKSAILGLKKEVEKAADSEKKERALAYCNGCIDACELALEQLNAKKEADAPTEEKPKKKRAAKKAKAEEPTPAEEPVKEEAPAAPELTTDDLDLDDLL